MISGATGPKAASVNGVFEPTGEVYNGKVLFAKRGDADKWLRFVASTGKWTVSPTKDKDENSTNGWCFSAGPEKGHANPVCVTQWRVYTGSVVEDQASATCVEFVPPVVISGALGPNAASVNGVFEPTGEVYNGKVELKSVGERQRVRR